MTISLLSNPMFVDLSDTSVCLLSGCLKSKNIIPYAPLKVLRSSYFDLNR